jgi:cell division protein ZapA
MSEEIKQVPVRILGKEYMIACAADEMDELLESARLLDRKMREIRDSGKVIGTERIAVMTALNMAHELVKCGSTKRLADPALQERLLALQERIDNVLAQEDRQLKL